MNPPLSLGKVRESVGAYKIMLPKRPFHIKVQIKLLAADAKIMSPGHQSHESCTCYIG